MAQGHGDGLTLLGGQARSDQIAPPVLSHYIAHRVSQAQSAMHLPKGPEVMLNRRFLSSGVNQQGDETLDIGEKRRQDRRMGPETVRPPCQPVGPQGPPTVISEPGDPRIAPLIKKAKYTLTFVL